MLETAFARRPFKMIVLIIALGFILFWYAAIFLPLILLMLAIFTPFRNLAAFASIVALTYLYFDFNHGLFISEMLEDSGMTPLSYLFNSLSGITALIIVGTTTDFRAKIGFQMRSVLYLGLAIMLSVLNIYQFKLEHLDTLLKGFEFIFGGS